MSDPIYSVLDALKKIENPSDDVKAATDQVEKMSPAEGTTEEEAKVEATAEAPVQEAPATAEAPAEVPTEQPATQNVSADAMGSDLYQPYTVDNSPEEIARLAGVQQNVVTPDPAPAPEATDTVDTQGTE
tara:strand:- start:57 stop:446 length:390 start_codon:yes stop_codon:yes gene_type:complete